MDQVFEVAGVQNLEDGCKNAVAGDGVFFSRRHHCLLQFAQVFDFLAQAINGEDLKIDDTAGAAIAGVAVA